MSALADVRRAAQVLREAARKASPGPWGIGNGTTVAVDVEQTSSGSFSCRYAIAEMDDDRESWLAADEDNPARPEDDAIYIALMQPQVGLALAAWLDGVAELATERTVIPAVMAIVRPILAADDALAAAEAVTL